MPSLALHWVAIENEAVDAAQVAVAFGVIHAVADDEIVGDVEPDVPGREVERSGRRLAQQRAQRNAGRAALPQGIEDRAAGSPGVEDVFDHQDIAALEAKAI